MSKYKSGNYLQLSRSIFPNNNGNSIDYGDVSPLSRWVYCCMNELEHRYTGKKVKFFFHTNEEMATFCGVSVWTIKKAKRELSEYSFIKTSQMHWVERETKRKSERHVTAYRICDR